MFQEIIMFIGILILLVAIVYFMANFNQMIENRQKKQSPYPQPYCHQSRFGCCPYSPTPRNDEIGSNCI